MMMTWGRYEEGLLIRQNSTPPHSSSHGEVGCERHTTVGGHWRRRRDVAGTAAAVDDEGREAGVEEVALRRRRHGGRRRDAEGEAGHGDVREAVGGLRLSAALGAARLVRKVGEVGLEAREEAGLEGQVLGGDGRREVHRRAGVGRRHVLREKEVVEEPGSWQRRRYVRRRRRWHVRRRGAGEERRRRKRQHLAALAAARRLLLL
mmetsp:Transcript_13940/g.42162  ORF Transcript_13940/g.42162 Transcript_13940/m.42162 type:complete len:205 (-) Transcript_13940:1225-1839(-)